MKLLINFAFLLLSTLLYSQNFNYEYVINWSELNSGVNTSLNSIAVNNYGSNVVATCGNVGVILLSTNLGVTWNNISSGMIPANIDLYTVSIGIPNIVIAAGNSGNTTYVYRTDNGGLNWTLVLTQPEGKINSIFLGLNNFSFMVGNPVGGRWSLWKSSNQGAVWDSSGLYLAQQENETGWQNSCMVLIDYNGLYNIWFGTNNNKIYHSANSAGNWVAENFPEENVYSIYAVGRYVLGGGSNLYSSTNYGSPWEFETTPGTGSINGILYPGLIVIMPADNIMNSPTFFIRSNNKIYYSDNGGGSDWEVKYTSANGNYHHMASTSNNIWAVKDNGEITRGAIDVITSVTPNNYPYSFELKQNYPNPFNPKTTIPIFIYKSTHISVKIYDASGKFLETLLEEQKNILYLDNIIDYGYIYRLEWNASNFPSGVYYYEVVGDDFKESRKMVLVK
ncbi:MAG: T9SS type A sorting domain-containing protein [Ignavibacteria bacterium]